MQPRNFIVRYLDIARLMQVATCAAGKPWCATVYFAHDNLHNLYWISVPETRHSQELAQNPRVAGTIVLPHTYGEPVHGLQFEGMAREVTDPDEIRSLSESYIERYGRYNLAEEIISGANPNHLYQIVPETFVLFDQANFPTQPRQSWQPDVT